MTKYDFDFPVEVINRNTARLTNQIWKLIPMYEHNEDWKKQLNTVIMEIAGLNEIFIEKPQFL
jgi:predicted ATP-dependent Lon-type protease